MVLLKLSTIVNLCLQIQNSEWEDVNGKLYKPDVFVEFYGHVNALRIRYYARGWRYKEEATWKKEIEMSLDDAIERTLNETIEELIEIRKHPTC